MRATEEAAFWLYSAKDWIDGMNAFVPDRLKAYALSMACELLLKYCIVINGGSPPEAHSHVLLAQEVGKLGGQVPKDVRVHLRTIKEYEARSPSRGCEYYNTSSDQVVSCTVWRVL